MTKGDFFALARFIAALALGLTLARPSGAQIALGSQVTLGSPAEAPGIATGAGVFDIAPDRKKTDAAHRAQLQGEYRFGDVLWILAPFVGLMGTSGGAFYGYAGFGFDVNFGANWVITPTIAGGYWYRGGDLNLGSWWEFRSGAEFDYRFADRSRLGIAFYHMSNAGLTKENPGEEALLLVYTVPLH
ncbi:MAG: acyloxyacyl hydrolase [Stellaceae bacterium]